MAAVTSIVLSLELVEALRRRPSASKSPGAAGHRAGAELGSLGDRQSDEAVLSAPADRLGLARTSPRRRRAGWAPASRGGVLPHALAARFAGPHAVGDALLRRAAARCSASRRRSLARRLPDLPRPR